MRVNVGQAKTDLSARFLAARGALAGQIEILDDFELSEQEIDEILAEPV